MSCEDPSTNYENYQQTNGGPRPQTSYQDQRIGNQRPNHFDMQQRFEGREGSETIIQGCSYKAPPFARQSPAQRHWKKVHDDGGYKNLPPLKDREVVDKRKRYAENRAARDERDMEDEERRNEQLDAETDEESETPFQTKRKNFRAKWISEAPANDKVILKRQRRWKAEDEEDIKRDKARAEKNMGDITKKRRSPRRGNTFVPFTDSGCRSGTDAMERHKKRDPTPDDEDRTGASDTTPTPMEVV